MIVSKLLFHHEMKTVILFLRVGSD